MLMRLNLNFSCPKILFPGYLLHTSQLEEDLFQVMAMQIEIKNFHNIDMYLPPCAKGNNSKCEWFFDSASRRLPPIQVRLLGKQNFHSIDKPETLSKA